MYVIKSNSHKLDPSHSYTIVLKQLAKIFMENSVYTHPQLPMVEPRVTEGKLRVTIEKPRVNKPPNAVYT